MTVPGPAVTDIPAAVEAALALRRELGVRAEDPLPCVLSLAEDHLGLDVVVAPLPEGWSGFYLPRPTRGLIAVNSTHAVVRQRFTIAHELGHHVLGHGAAPRVVAIAETPSAVEVAPGAADGRTTGTGTSAPSGEAGASVAGADAAGPAAAGASPGTAGSDPGNLVPGDSVPSGDATDPRSASRSAGVGPVPGATSSDVASPPAPSSTTTAVPAPAAEPPRKTRDPKERAANAFAAELLCPASAARGFVSRYAPAATDDALEIDFDLVVRFSAAFGLSAWAVVMRLGTSKILPDGPVRDGLQARVNAEQHIPMYRKLGLRALSDELELIASTGLPRMSEGANAAQLISALHPDRAPDDLPPPVRELRRMLGLDGEVG